jgi:hypothetical protein
VALLSAQDGIAGAMISASHNPFGDNGIKFFAPGGLKLTDAVEAELEAELERGLAASPPVPADPVPTGGAPPPHPGPAIFGPEEAGLDRIGFAWAGGAHRGARHYYCITAPDFLIEYDNTQDGGNHAHSVWRHLRHDFGADLLRLHYANQHPADAG